MLKNIFFAFFFFMSCKSSDENTDASETKKGKISLPGKVEYDSVKLYRDFDWVKFSGQGQIVDVKDYPYVRLSYKKDSLFMSIYYSENDFEERKFFRLENNWANLMRSKFKREGEYHYFLTVFLPQGCTQIEYVKNPFKDSDNEMYEIGFLKSSNQKISYTYYMVASSGLKDIFPINKVTESLARGNAFFIKFIDAAIDKTKVTSITKKYSDKDLKKLIFTDENSPFVYDISNYESFFYYEIKNQNKYLVNGNF
jgi:hypothetical protein